MKLFLVINYTVLLFSSFFCISMLDTVNKQLTLKKNKESDVEKLSKNVVILLNNSFNGSNTYIISSIGSQNYRTEVLERLLYHAHGNEKPLAIFDFHDNKSYIKYKMNIKQNGLLNEPKKVFLWIVENDISLKNIWQNLEPKNEESTFMIVLLLSSLRELSNAKEELKYHSVFQHLWENFQFLNVVIIHYHYFGFKPLKLIVYNPFTSKLQHLTSYCALQNFIFMRINKVLNLHKYPFRVSIFQRVPTAVLSGKINETLCYKTTEGIDGLVLEVVARYLNFTSINCEPEDGAQFGHMDENGNFTGSMGDLLYKRAEIAFNSRFIKEYDTADIQFTFPVTSDNLCVLVSKASRVPKWLTIFLTVTESVKILLFISFVVSFIFMTIIKRIYSNISNRKDKVDYISNFFQMLQIFISHSVIRLPSVSSQRLFIGSCVLFSLVFVSAFQGQVVTVISKPLYYKDINTLQQLAESGMKIGIGAKNLMDTFSNEEDPVLEKLESRLVLFTQPNLEELIAMGKLKMATLVRLSNAGEHIYKAVKKGEEQKFHIVEQCPRDYSLTYIMRKGSPFLSSVNRVLARTVQSGLVGKWSKNTSEYKIKIHLSTHRVFSVADLQLSFYLLVVGLALSIIAFVIEMTMKKINCL